MKVRARSISLEPTLNELRQVAFAQKEIIDDLVVVLRAAKEALYNVPLGGDEFDIQQSNEHMRIALDIDVVLGKV